MNILAVSWNKYNIFLIYCTEHVQHYIHNITFNNDIHNVVF
jgi:hypothetical protein